MHIWSDPVWVSRSPLVTIFLFEFANSGQVWPMWHFHTAAGQNFWSWVLVNIALWIYANYYRVMLPQERFVKWSNAVGIFINSLVILSVVYFRYL